MHSPNNPSFMRRIAGFISLLLLSVCLYAQRATIEKTWLEHGVMVNGVQGMKIHAKFQVSNLRGVPCQMTVFFYDSQYKPWKGLDSRYCCANGYVSTREDFRPGYDNTTYNDYTAFIPYSQMNLPPGKNSYHCIVYLWSQRNGQFVQLAQGSYMDFDGTGGGNAPSPSPRQQQQPQQQPSASNFPVGQVKYYIDNERTGCIRLNFYYNNYGDQCFDFVNPKWINGIKFKYFGVKNGMMDFGQYSERYKMSTNTTFVKETIRTYQFSFCEAMHMSADYSYIKQYYGSKVLYTYTLTNKATYDAYMKKYKESAVREYRNSNSGGAAPSAPKNQYQRTNRTDYETCYACHGTGRCPGCNGTGDMGDSHNFHKEKVVMRCSSCSGSGKCLSCHGRGRVVKAGGY